MEDGNLREAGQGRPATDAFCGPGFGIKKNLRIY